MYLLISRESGKRTVALYGMESLDEALDDLRFFAGHFAVKSVETAGRSAVVHTKDGRAIEFRIVEVKHRLPANFWTRQSRIQWGH